MIDLVRNSPGKALAIAQIVLSLCARGGYFIVGDYRRSLYWILAAGITATVTF